MFQIRFYVVTPPVTAPVTAWHTWHHDGGHRVPEARDAGRGLAHQAARWGQYIQTIWRSQVTWSAHCGGQQGDPVQFLGYLHEKRTQHSRNQSQVVVKMFKYFRCLTSSVSLEREAMVLCIRQCIKKANRWVIIFIQMCISFDTDKSLTSRCWPSNRCRWTLTSRTSSRRSPSCSSASVPMSSGEQSMKRPVVHL